LSAAKITQDTNFKRSYKITKRTKRP